MRPLIDRAQALLKAINGDLSEAFEGSHGPRFNTPQADALFKVHGCASALQQELYRQRDRMLPSGAVTLSPATIDRFRDLIHQVEDRFLIEHLRPGSVPAQHGRRSLQLLVKLVDEVFPCHPETPVSGLDTGTVAEPGTAVESAHGEG